MAYKEAAKKLMFFFSFEDIYLVIFQFYSYNEEKKLELFESLFLINLVFRNAQMQSEVFRCLVAVLSCIK